MSDRNCWRCRYNTAKNCCQVIDGDACNNEGVADATGEWIGDNIPFSAKDMMPAHETPTPCPGFAPVAEGV